MQRSVGRRRKVDEGEVDLLALLYLDDPRRLRTAAAPAVLRQQAGHDVTPSGHDVMRTGHVATAVHRRQHCRPAATQ